MEVRPAPNTTEEIVAAKPGFGVIENCQYFPDVENADDVDHDPQYMSPGLVWYETAVDGTTVMVLAVSLGSDEVTDTEAEVRFHEAICPHEFAQAKRTTTNAERNFTLPS